MKTKKAKAKDPKKSAAAKKAWETKRANAKKAAKAPAKKAAKKAAPAKKATPAKKAALAKKAAPAKKAPAAKKAAKKVAAKKAAPKDPKRIAAARKAWKTKRANAKTPTKKAVVKAPKGKKAKGGRPKKIKTSNAVISFVKLAEVSGISLKKLRTTAKRKSLPITVANDSFHGITQDKIPVLVAEVKANELSANKLEKIQKDEVWFEELRQELDLTVKQLETRCKRNSIETFNRYPELSFQSHFRRAIKKADAEKLRSLYVPVNEKEIKALVDLALN